MRNLLVFCILISALSHSFSQANNYIFERINNRHGLSSDHVYEICQDKEGFIWVATPNGLNCYSGDKIQIFTSQNNDKSAIVSSFIGSLCPMPDNNKIWVGTLDKGISIFDRQRNEAEHINMFSETPFQLLSNRVNNIFLDSKNCVWISTSLGLTKYNRTNGEVNHYLRKKNIMVTYEDSRGNIIVGTWGDSFFILNKDDNKFTKEDQSISLLEPSGEKIKIPSPDNVKSLFEDKKGNLWIGSWSNGLYKAHMSKGKIIIVQHIPIINENFSKDQMFDIVYDIDQDKNGHIWLGTDAGIGIIKNPYSEKCTINWIKPGNDPTNFRAKDAANIFIDAAKTIWIGTQGDGISKVDFNASNFTTYSTNSSSEFTSNIFCSFWEHKDELYTGIYASGFGKYNISTQKFTPYKKLDLAQGIKMVPNAITKCIPTDDDYWWLAIRYQGIFKYNIETKKAHRLKFSKYIGEINDLLIDDDNVWIAAQQALILLEYDSSSSNKIFPYKKTIFRKEQIGVSSQNISKLIKDNDGNLWLSYIDGGLVKATINDEISFESIASCQHLELETMYEDSQGHLWLGTRFHGLQLLNRTSNNIHPNKRTSTIRGSRIYAMIEDEYQTLWMSTNKGISSMSISNEEAPYITNYAVEDGLQGNVYFRNSVYKDADGRIYFGGFHGFNAFLPKDIKQNTYVPHMAFTDFEIDRKKTTVAYSNNEPLVITHKNSSFSIEFAALSHTKSFNNQYQFILEGYDKDWVATNGSNNAVYGTIPPGNYTFKVKGSNNNGVWNDQPLLLNVKVLKSPYKTLVAYIIYMVVLIIIILILLFYARKNIRLKQAYKDEQNERLRVEKINQFKLKFFTNISHELLTPLSIISNSADQYVARRPKAKNDLAIIRRNTQRLTHLINQLLDFRKIESEGKKLYVKKADINMLILSLKDNFIPLCEQKKLNFIIDGACPNELYFDSDKIDKILHNILSNAFKHSPINGNITLRYKHYYNETIEHLSISVQDEGKGIPTEYLEQIFDRFYRIDDRKHESGAGIGLAFSKALATIHKGKISAKNNASGGAIFTLDIPVSMSAYSEDDVEIGEDTEIISQASFDVELDEIKNSIIERKNNNEELPKILIIEDNHDMRHILRDYLSDYFEIYESENGTQGLQTLNAVEIELIVSDIMMPEMDGLTFCRKIKNDVTTSHIPIILTTAKRTQDDVKEGYEAQADSFITKPVNLELLTIRIINLLKQRKTLHKYFLGNSTIEPQALKIANIDQEILDKIKTFIMKHVANSELSVGMISEHTGVSSSALYRKIKSFTGSSLNEYIKIVRLNYGETLLREGLIPSEVTYLCGFSDPSYFGACFKKKFGLTPKKYIEKLTSEQ